MIEIQLSDKKMRESYQHTKEEKESLLREATKTAGSSDKAPNIAFDGMPDQPDIFYHKNMMKYLSIAWHKHTPVVVTPDMIWFTILNRISEAVRENPSKYRHHFTNKLEKQTITIPTDNFTDFISQLVVELDKLVPMNVNLMTPKFTTSTNGSRICFKAAFCDAVSPFYDYFMYLCEIPKIILQGTKEDWLHIKSNLQEMSLLDEDHLKNYFAIVTEKINGILDTLDGADNTQFWKDFFRLERCGSGHQQEFHGWVSKLCNFEAGAMTNNIPTDIAKVPFKQMHDPDTQYNFYAGIFTSQLSENGVLIPNFNFFVEKQSKDQEEK